MILQYEYGCSYQRSPTCILLSLIREELTSRKDDRPIDQLPEELGFVFDQPGCEELKAARRDKRQPHPLRALGNLRRSLLHSQK